MQTIVRTKQDILSVLHQNRFRLKALGVKDIGLFGSFVRDEQRPDSDIDLLVEFEPNRKTFDSFMELSFFLEDVLRHRVELITVESLSPYLGPHIIKEVEYVAFAS
jgi:predicted nucleotidyltransferase